MTLDSKLKPFLDELAELLAQRVAIKLEDSLNCSGCHKETNIIQNEPKFYTAEEVCKRYKISLPTLWRWRKSRYIPEPKKIGPKSTRWSAADLDEFDEKIK